MLKTNKRAAVVNSSAFLKFIEKFFAFLGGLCKKSKVVSVFFMPPGAAFNGSAAYGAYGRLLCLPGRLGNFFGKVFAPLFQKSLFLRALREARTLFAEASFCDAGLAFAAAFAARLIFAPPSPASLAGLAAGCLLLFVNVPVRETVQTASAVKFLAFCFNLKTASPNMGKYKRSLKKTALFFALGLYAGLLFSFMGFFYALAGALLPVCAVALFSYPFLGVLAAVFLVPFAPTLALAGLLIATFFAFCLKLASNPRYAAKRDVTGFFIAVFMALSAVSAVFSLAPAQSVSIAALLMVFYAGYHLTVSLTRTRAEFAALVFAFALSALLAALYGFLQALSGARDMTWVDKELFESLGMRVFSTFKNPNVYGEYLLIAIPAALIGAALSKRAVLKLFYSLTAGALCVNLALTYSRGCYVALVFAVFVAVVMAEKRLTAFFAAALFALPLVLPGSVVNRLLSVTNMADSSSKYRLSIYQAAVRLLKNFWPSGVGQGEAAFNRVFPFYAFNGVTAPHTHNMFLQVFVETGVFGFAAFMCVIAAFFKTVSAAYAKRKNFTDKWVLACSAAFMSGFCLQGAFDYTFYNYKVCALFFICLAFPKIYADCYI